MIDFITGDRFIEIADFVYAPTTPHPEDYGKLVNTFHPLMLTGGTDIIYTHTFYVKELFEIIRYINQKFIVITHNSDQNIDESYNLPLNVLKWYAQNVNVINPRIIPIPIGLENDRWFADVRKKEKMTAKFEHPKRIRNLVYMNFNIQNNVEERRPLYYQLKDMPFVTTKMGANGQDFDDYIDNIYNHRFVVCPAGNGLDTHRLWETLYMRSIPIMKKGFKNWSPDYPILYVKDWNKINEEFLNEMRFFFEEEWNEWDRKELTLNYWRNRITGK